MKLKNFTITEQLDDAFSKVCAEMEISQSAAFRTFLWGAIRQYPKLGKIEVQKLVYSIRDEIILDEAEARVKNRKNKIDVGTAAVAIFEELEK